MSNLMGGRSLRDDSNLIDLLKKHSDLVHERMLDTDSRLRTLCNDVSTLTRDLNVAQNTLCTMKDQRYVKEVIVDDYSDIRSRLSESRAPTRAANADREGRYRDAVLYAVNAGLRLVDQMYHPVDVQIPNEALLDKSLLPEPVWEPLDPYLVRDLPPLIGSREFDDWQPGETKISNEGMEVSEIVIGRNRNSAMPSNPIPALSSPSTSHQNPAVPSTSLPNPVPPPPAPQPPPISAPSHIIPAKHVNPAPQPLNAPILPVSSTPISQAAGIDPDEFGDSMRISAPLTVVTEPSAYKASDMVEKPTNAPEKPSVANLGPKIVPLSAADEARIKKHSIFSDESDDEDSSGDLFAAAKSLSQSRAAPRLPPKSSPQGTAPPPPSKTQKSPSQPQRSAELKPTSNGPLLASVYAEQSQKPVVPSKTEPNTSGTAPPQTTATLGEKPKPMNSKAKPTIQKSLFQDSDDDEFERLFGASSLPKKPVTPKSVETVKTEEKVTLRSPAASTPIRSSAHHRSLFDSTSSSDDEVDLFANRSKPDVLSAPPVEESVQPLPPVESKPLVVESAPEDPLAATVQLESSKVERLAVEVPDPKLPAFVPVSEPQPSTSAAEFGSTSVANPFEFSINSPPPLPAASKVANPLIPPEAPSPPNPPPEHSPPVVSAPVDPLSSSAIEADDEQSQREEEEMPKAVLSSVGNDFSNRLNAALLRKPPTTVGPITKDVEPLASTLTPSPIRRTASASVETRKSESVKALSSRLGDSITRAHTRGRTPSSTAADSDSAAKKSGSSSDSDTKERAKPAAAAVADPFAAVKSRAGPQRRRPPSARPASVAVTADSAKPPPPKSPVLTSKPAAEKTPKSPAKKPLETSKSTNAAKSLKSIFDTDSSDDPF